MNKNNTVCPSEGAVPQKHTIVWYGVMCFMLAFCMLLSACSPKVSMVIQKDASAVIDFKTNASLSLESLLRVLTGISAGVSVFDEHTIRDNFNRNISKNADGTALVRINSLSTPPTAHINMNLSVLNSASEILPGITPISLNTSATSTVMNLSLSASAVRSTMRLMPPETNDFLELLMAPVFTGEALTAAEYTDLIAVVYGSSASRELAVAAVTLSITVPETILTASVTAPATLRFAQKTVHFVIPLTTLLTLEEPIECVVEWK